MHIQIHYLQNLNWTSFVGNVQRVLLSIPNSSLQVFIQMTYVSKETTDILDSISRHRSRQLRPKKCLLAAVRKNSPSTRTLKRHNYTRNTRGLNKDGTNGSFVYSLVQYTPQPCCGCHWERKSRCRERNDEEWHSQ